MDEAGNVVETVTRSRMRAANLRHRTVGVVVRTTGGEVVVHQRAAWKDVWPSYWDVAFGGVLEPGESWIDGARRELAEEAGIQADAHRVRRRDLPGRRRVRDREAVPRRPRRAVHLRRR